MKIAIRVVAMTMIVTKEKIVPVAGIRALILHMSRLLALKLRHFFFQILFIQFPVKTASFTATCRPSLTASGTETIIRPGFPVKRYLLKSGHF
jgi:hypothetical protein